jgi:hypothetical protein
VVSSSKDCCAVTKFSYSVGDAHLVPRAERLWYIRNGMGRYGQILGDINNSANILPLRADILHCSDDRWFVIVPKLVTPPSHQYVTHLISQEAAELWPAWHNTLVQNIPINSTPYLFAHFAWAVLLRAKPFIIMGISRNMVRLVVKNEDEFERKIESVSVGCSLRLSTAEHALHKIKDQETVLSQQTVIA